MQKALPVLVMDLKVALLNEEKWADYYSAHALENTLPTLSVGKDETCVSLCWHCAKESAKPQVMVSECADMAQFRVFSGVATAAENSNQLVCRVEITQLKENTEYFYRWYTENGWSKTARYKTKPFGAHKALVVGDIQITEIHNGDSAEQRTDGLNWNNLLVKTLASNDDIAYLVSPGDNTSTGKNAAEWQTLLMPEALRGLPLALAIGNHDKKGEYYNYYTNMPNEFYGRYFYGLDRDFWFRYGDVLYLVFDSTSGSAPDHMAMAKQAVEKNADVRWRIGVVHHGIYGAGDCIGDKETEILLTAVFVPIFEAFDLDFVITGHTHSQGRSHFMLNGKIAGKAESGGTYTDPKGIVYLNANSVCGKVVMDYSAEHLAYSFMENDVTTATTLDFNGDTLTVETRRGDSGELLDSLVLRRTQPHSEGSAANKCKRAAYKAVEALGFVYAKADAFIRKHGK